MPKAKFKTKVTRSRSTEALRRLRNHWQEANEGEEWEGHLEPVITPMLKEHGIPTVINALRMHDDDDARSFLEIWDGCTQTDRGLLRVEDLAFASGIGSLRLAEITQTALYLYASMRTKMLIASAMPKVTKSIIKAATDEVPITASIIRADGEVVTKVVGHTNGDVKAMELFGRISGIAPVPKGATIAIQNVIGDRDPDEKSGTSQPSWKTAEERLREFQDATEPKRLPSPHTPPITIGGHIDKLQAETVELMRGE